MCSLMARATTSASASEIPSGHLSITANTKLQNRIGARESGSAVSLVKHSHSDLSVAGKRCFGKCFFTSREIKDSRSSG